MGRSFVRVGVAATFTLAAALGLAALSGLSGCKDEGLRIEGVEPPFGNVAGGDDIVITGSGFKPGLQVQFRKRPVTRTVIESDTKIRVKTPPGGEGKADVVVTDSTGRTYVLENSFSYRRE